MEWVKSVFGIALVALALSYLKDAFPSFRGLLETAGVGLGRTVGGAAAAVLVFTGVAIGAVHLSFKEGRQWVPKAFGVVSVLLAILLRGALPADAARGENRDLKWAVVFNADAERSTGKFETALAKAKADCKPVLIDFFAEWCAACKELDRETYAAGSVVAESEKFVNVKVDGTVDHEALDGIYQRFGVRGLPTVAFVDPAGRILNDPHVTGYMPPDRFLEEMQKVPRECSGRP
jgi:thioredoxin:protein disulfide reductase